jgi:hypothetical protein
MKRMRDSKANAPESKSSMMCMVVAPWWLELIVAVNPYCAYHRGKPFVKDLALVHRHAPDSACTAWLVWFDDSLEVVGLALYEDCIAELYFIAVAFVD